MCIRDRTVSEPGPTASATVATTKTPSPKATATAPPRTGTGTLTAPVAGVLRIVDAWIPYSQHRKDEMAAYAKRHYGIDSVSYTHLDVYKRQPYIRLGMPLVEACAIAGTHYCDLTGEVLFVRQSADTWHETARETGARIVHSCGFDSIPSDLGVLVTADTVAADGAGELTETVLSVVSMRGLSLINI